jgi:hypothetical protein
MNERRTKSTISRATTHREIAEFWNSHDLSEYWEQTKSVKMEVDLESEVTYYALESQLAEQVERLARRRGVSPETLLNLWVQEKLQER